MTLDRLKELLDTYGADPDRWPLEERIAMLDLLARSETARDLAAQAASLDALLDRAPLPMPSHAASEVLADRVMRRLNLRSVLAAHRPAFGWPNWVALAAAAVAGLVIGWSTLGVGSGLAAGPELADVLSSPAALEGRLW